MANTIDSTIVQLARGARRVAFFTGAGVSAESGLATFRDAETGLWSHVDPIAMADINAWRRDPSRIWPWYLWRLARIQQAKPNPAHVAIAQWAARLNDAGSDSTSPADSTSRRGNYSWGHVTTQNVDDLHERAGSSNVAHLHGSLFAFRCDRCDAPAPTPTPPEQEVEVLAPPRCQKCSRGNIRPGVVWFGEMLPEQAWAEAEHRAISADLMVVIGTSGVVYPAAGLPLAALDAGVPVLEISPEPTQLTPYVTHHIEQKAGAALPELVAALESAD